MSIQGEARAEAERRNPETYRYDGDDLPNRGYQDLRDEFMAGIEWLASRQPEAAPATPVSDTDREALTDKALWDFADDLMDAWGVADENPPSLSEKFRDMFVARFRRSPVPQQVSTVEELDALPVSTVIIDRVGQAHQKAMGGCWYLAAGDDLGRDAIEYARALPATVLWAPDTEGSESGE